MCGGTRVGNFLGGVLDTSDGGCQDLIILYLDVQGSDEGYHRIPGFGFNLGDNNVVVLEVFDVNITLSYKFLPLESQPPHYGTSESYKSLPPKHLQDLSPTT